MATQLQSIQGVPGAALSALAELDDQPPTKNTHDHPGESSPINCDRVLGKYTHKYYIVVTVLGKPFEIFWEMVQMKNKSHSPGSLDLLFFCLRDIVIFVGNSIENCVAFHHVA